MLVGPIVDPNGATAMFDRDRTIAAYREIDADADCSCINCRNYRAAWRLKFMPFDLVRACRQMGIDPSKALEVMALSFDTQTGLQGYIGHLPFFGLVTRRVTNNSADWSLDTTPNGTVRIEPDAREVSFVVYLPWILNESNPNPEVWRGP